MSANSSMICKNFAQNAWKKDLCSNCFKSEVEHNDWMNSAHTTAPVVQRQTQTQQSNTTNININEDGKASHQNISESNNQSSNHSPIKALNINKNCIQTNQINSIANNPKTSTDCLNTTTTILSSKKLTNNSSPQILMNTKKSNSAYVSTHNTQIINGFNNNISINSNNKCKDSIKQFNTNNNCSELRKRMNATCAEESTAVQCKNKTIILSKDSKNIPQLSNDKIILTKNNLNNNTINNQNQKQSTVAAQVVNNSSKSAANTNTSTGMPVIGILKTRINGQLIKYQPKRKCLVFKEGDPQIIGYGIEGCDDWGSDDNEEDDDYDEEDSDDDWEDEQLYTSDDKELRELTRVNTKFNTNAANFAINTIKETSNESKVKQIVIQTNNSCNQSEEQSVNANKVLSDSHTIGVNCVNTNSTNNTNNTTPMTTTTSITNNISKGLDLCDGPQHQPIVINNSIIDVTIPEVCEKLVQKGINESYESINNCNNSNVCDESHSPITQSPIANQSANNSDVNPMSTSSDSYSSSDEKEDSQTIDIKNFRQHLLTKPNETTNHLRTDSESDSLSTNSDSSIEVKTNYRPESVQIRAKPKLPVKPNMNTTTKPVFTTNSIQIDESHQNSIIISSKSDEKDSEKEVESQKSEPEEYSPSYSPQLVSDDVYNEIYESSDAVNGIVGKFADNCETNNNYLMTETKHTAPEGMIKSSEKRELKLAELAQELEQVRHMKRPAPQPPTSKRTETEQTNEEQEDNRKQIIKQTVCKSNSNSGEHKSSPPNHTKHRFSSIRKLLHKKTSTDKSLSDKSKVNSTESLYSNYGSNGSVISPGADRKAWKQSEFDRSNLTIVHPIDLIARNDNKTSSAEEDLVQQQTESRPEAPPRTPKPSRPSVPARKRNKSSSNHMPPPAREPPAPPTISTPPMEPLSLSLVSSSTSSSELSSLTTSVVDMNVNNNLNEAYNQLAKSSFSNLLAIKSNIESKFSEQDYNWTDFEVTNAIKMGSVLVYKDCIVSKTQKSVNLLVLDDCYSSPIVSQFRHHSELVLVLDQQWKQYYLLDELTESTKLEEKQINSLILQLYSILEYLENNNCNELPENTIQTIIICASDEDILLIVPQINSNKCLPDTNERDASSAPTPTTVSNITLHQFLSQVLAKLLPNSLFESVGHVLSQPTVQISHSKTIVQLIAFQIPVHQMSDSDLQINYWFDINRSKFVNQFCCLFNGTKLLTQLDYIYLKFLCNNSIDLIRHSIELITNTSTDTNSKKNSDLID